MFATTRGVSVAPMATLASSSAETLYKSQDERKLLLTLEEGGELRQKVSIR